MKTCHLCGYENQDTAKFCLSCGSNLQMTSQQEPQTNMNQNIDDASEANPNVQYESSEANPNVQYDSQANTQTDYQQANPNGQYSNQQYNTNQYSNNPYNNQQYPNQQTNPGQNPYQGGYYPPVNQKNVAVAVLLNFIGGMITYLLCGIGQLYLGLHKRGIALCLIGLFINILNVLNIYFVYNDTLYLLLLVVGIVYMIYCIYDAYVCTKAINESRPIPLLFGSLDIQ